MNILMNKYDDNKMDSSKLNQQMPQEPQMKNISNYQPSENKVQKKYLKKFKILRNQPKTSKNQEKKNFVFQNKKRENFNKGRNFMPEMKYRQTIGERYSGKPFKNEIQSRYLPSMTSVMEKTNKINYQRNNNVINIPSQNNKNITLINKIPNNGSIPTMNSMNQMGQMNQIPGLNQVVIKHMNVPHGISYLSNAKPQAHLPQMNNLFSFNKSQDTFKQNTNNRVPFKKNNVILTVRPLNIVQINPNQSKKYYVKAGGQPQMIPVPVPCQLLGQQLVQQLAQPLSQPPQPSTFPVNLNQYPPNQLKNIVKW